MKKADGPGGNLNVVCNIFLHDHSVKTVSAIIRIIYSSLTIWEKKTFYMHTETRFFLYLKCCKNYSFLKKSWLKCLKLRAGTI